MIGTLNQDPWYGSAFIYRYDGSTWSREASFDTRTTDANSTDRFGSAVAISGSQALIGAYDQNVGGQEGIGAVYVFEHEDGNWSQVTKLIPHGPTLGDEFGSSVALQDGIATVGIPNADVDQHNQGAAWMYDYSSLQAAPSVSLDAKVLLEGFYDTSTGLMQTDLTSFPDFPLAHPFSSEPWNHTGSEAVSALPAPTIVDWVLIQLRSATTPSTIVASQAAFLLDDGTIVDVDGQGTVSFGNVPPDTYYVTVLHSGHLSITSAQPVDFSNGAGICDFTLSGSTYGSDSQIELGSSIGTYGMRAGDINADGQVDGSDKILWLGQRGSVSGYFPSDLNGDGQVDGSDKILWLGQRGRVCQVP